MLPPDDAVARTQRRAILTDAVSIGVAVGGYGLAFGAVSVSSGFSPAQTVASSLLTFTGGTQFAIAGVIAGGGGAAAALGTGYLLGARNTLYAMRLQSTLGATGWRRLLAALFTIDESSAMAFGQAKPAAARLAFWWTAGSVYLCWNLATLIGAIGAHALGDPSRYGLDAAVPAAFLALLAPRLRQGAPARRVALAAAVLAAALIAITPQGVPVLAACLALFAAVRPVRNRHRRGDGQATEKDRRGAGEDRR